MPYSLYTYSQVISQHMPFGRADFVLQSIRTRTAEEISKEEYDQWRYNYPKLDITQHWAKVPSEELSDALVEAFKDKLPD